ncbi:hypothetical protein EIP91_010548, partial [Steccherinum ochraceum]
SAKPSVSASTGHIAGPSTSRTTRSLTRLQISDAKTSFAAALTTRASTGASATNAVPVELATPGRRSSRNSRALARPKKWRGSDR